MEAQANKNQHVLSAAEEMYRQDPDWVTFFREVLGIEGCVRKSFPNFDDLTEFERSDEYAKIQKMLVKLREKKSAGDSEIEPTRVITVRLPKSMHEYLQTEAHDLRTSMNKLCISKLLQVIEQDMIPAEKTAPPQRRNRLTTVDNGVASVPMTQPVSSESRFGSSSYQPAPLKTGY